MSLLARIVSLLVVAVLVGPSRGQLIPSFLGLGFCNDATSKQDFDMAKFSGTWFSLERTPNQYVQTSSCVYANYTLEGSNFEVIEFGKDKSGKDIQLNSIIKSGARNGLPMTVISEGVPEAPLKIIDTDYETYACMESCLQYALFRAQFAWTLTKSPPAAKTAISKCREVFKSLELDLGQLEKVHQGSGCTYPDWAKKRRV